MNCYLCGFYQCEKNAENHSQTKHKAHLYSVYDWFTGAYTSIKSIKVKVSSKLNLLILFLKFLNGTNILCKTIPRATSVADNRLTISAVIHYITKTYLYNFDPLKPHFYIVKLGFTGVYIIFLISAQNTDCEYSLEPPRRGGSNEYPQSMFCAEIWKISEFFIWKFSVFGGEIFYIFE